MQRPVDSKGRAKMNCPAREVHQNREQTFFGPAFKSEIFVKEENDVAQHVHQNCIESQPEFGEGTLKFERHLIHVRKFWTNHNTKQHLEHANTRLKRIVDERRHVLISCDVKQDAEHGVETFTGARQHFLANRESGQSVIDRALDDKIIVKQVICNVRVLFVGIDEPMRQRLAARQQNLYHFFQHLEHIHVATRSQRDIPGFENLGVHDQKHVKQGHCHAVKHTQNLQHGLNNTIHQGNEKTFPSVVQNR